MDGEVQLAERLTRIEAGLEGVKGDVVQLRATLTRVLDELKAKVEGTDEKLHQVELCDVRIEKDVRRLEEDVEVLKRQTRLWEGINTLAAVVAGLLHLK